MYIILITIMTERIERIIVTANRINNGKITLDKSIGNISKMRINDIVFNHGAKKKTKKKKKRRDDDSDDDSEAKYENGNTDLVDSTYIIVNIPNFTRGMFHDPDDRVTTEYTHRLFSLEVDFDDCGVGYWSRNNHNDYDWYSQNNKLQKINDLEIKLVTDVDSSPDHINFNIELEFVCVV